MCEIVAKAKLNGHDLNDVVVLNPGDWFGKCFLIEIGGSYSPLFLVVEADSVSDAIDELADSEKHGHLITVDEADLGDYPEEDRHYGPSGQVLDLDHLMVHGQEGMHVRFHAATSARICPNKECRPPTITVGTMRIDGHRAKLWDRKSGTGRHLLDFSLFSSQFLIFCPKR